MVLFGWLRKPKTGVIAQDMASVRSESETAELAMQSPAAQAKADLLDRLTHSPPRARYAHTIYNASLVRTLVNIDRGSG